MRRSELDKIKEQNIKEIISLKENESIWNTFYDVIKKGPAWEVDKKTLADNGYDSNRLRYARFVNMYTRGVKDFFDSELQLVIPCDMSFGFEILNLVAFYLYKKTILTEDGIATEKIDSINQELIKVPKEEIGFYMDLYLYFTDIKIEGSGALGYRIILPDREGNYPWNDDCNAFYKKQLEVITFE